MNLSEEMLMKFYLAGLDIQRWHCGDMKGRKELWRDHLHFWGHQITCKVTKKMAKCLVLMMRMKITCLRWLIKPVIPLSFNNHRLYFTILVASVAWFWTKISSPHVTTGNEFEEEIPLWLFMGIFCKLLKIIFWWFLLS